MPDVTLYVSTLGNDTTGDGSQGNPYATIQKANNVGTATRTGQTYIRLGNLGTHTITSTLTWDVNTDYRYHHHYDVWEESTSGNYVNLNGRMVPRWHINYTAASGDRFHGTTTSSGTMNYVHFHNGKFTSSASHNYGLTFATSGSVTLYNLEIDATNCNTSAVYQQYSRITAQYCNFYATGPYPNYILEQTGVGDWRSCRFSGADYEIGNSAHNHFSGCVFRNWGNSATTSYTRAFYAAGARSAYENCVFVGNTAEAQQGIITYQTETNLMLFNNIFVDVASCLTDWNTGSAVRCAGVIGNNALYNVYDTPYNVRGGLVSDYSHLDIVLTEDPFMDLANEDYRLKPNSPCRGRGIVFGGGVYPGMPAGVTVPTLRCDIGPIQYGVPNLPVVSGYVA